MKIHEFDPVIYPRKLWGLQSVQIHFQIDLKV